MGPVGQHSFGSSQTISMLQKFKKIRGRASAMGVKYLSSSGPARPHHYSPTIPIPLTSLCPGIPSVFFPPASVVGWFLRLEVFFKDEFSFSFLSYCPLPPPPVAWMRNYFVGSAITKTGEEEGNFCVIELYVSRQGTVGNHSWTILWDDFRNLRAQLLLIDGDSIRAHFVLEMHPRDQMTPTKKPPKNAE